jgi:cytochrome c553
MPDGPGVAHPMCMRPMRIGLLVLVMYAMACKTANPGAAPEGLSGSSAGAARAAAPTIGERMIDHARHGTAMRDAVARGDLAEGALEAKLLAVGQREVAIDRLWQDQRDAMSAAAMRVAEARTVPEASAALGQVARTCGDCHVLVRRSGKRVESPPTEAPGARPRMRQHEWAVTEMWRGLVEPSDDAWQAGARSLSETTLAPSLLTPGKTPVPKVGELAQYVRGLAGRAASVHDASGRAEIYGEIVSTCAVCHAWLGGGPSASAVP